MSLSIPRFARLVPVLIATAIATPSIATEAWDETRLDRAFDYARSLGTDTLLIRSNGETVRAMGDLTKPYHLHSMRKALLSALIGQHLGDGPDRISLTATLSDLGIDDDPVPLTDLQRTATVMDLLQSRSGINHKAAAEAGLFADKQRRLGDGENTPGTIWAYNNWDYNALTTIFEARTGQSVATAFKSGLAAPLGLQDIDADDIAYLAEPAVSRHRAAMFHMSARDLARFGQLYLNGGVWKDRQVLPADWTDRVQRDAVSTNGHNLGPAHGMLWWLTGPELGLPEGSYRAVGLGQQSVVVIPAWNSVIVHQADTQPLRQRLFTEARETGKSIGEILEATVEECFSAAGRDTRFCREDRFILPKEFARLTTMIAAARTHR